jgi:hypothetical protein
MSYIKVLTLNNGFLFSVFSICFLILTVFSVFFSVFFPCENAIVYSKYLFLTTGRDQRGTLCELTGSESLKSPPTILGGVRRIRCLTASKRSLKRVLAINDILSN